MWFNISDLLSDRVPIFLDETCKSTVLVLIHNHYHKKVPVHVLPMSPHNVFVHRSDTKPREPPLRLDYGGLGLIW